MLGFPAGGQVCFRPPRRSTATNFAGQQQIECSSPSYSSHAIFPRESSERFAQAGMKLIVSSGQTFLTQKPNRFLVRYFGARLARQFRLSTRCLVFHSWQIGRNILSGQNMCVLAVSREPQHTQQRISTRILMLVDFTSLQLLFVTAEFLGKKTLACSGVRATAHSKTANLMNDLHAVTLLNMEFQASKIGCAAPGQHATSSKVATGYHDYKRACFSKH